MIDISAIREEYEAYLNQRQATTYSLGDWYSHTHSGELSAQEVLDVFSEPVFPESKDV